MNLFGLVGVRFVASTRRSARLSPTATFVTLATAMASLVLMVPSAAASFATCTGSQASVGFYQPAGTNTWGTRATLVTRAIPLCLTDTSSQNFGSAWVMLSGQAGPVRNHVQAGYHNDPVNGSRYYEQRKTGGSGSQSNTFVWSATPVNGTQVQYSVSFNSGNQFMTSVAGFITIRSSLMNITLLTGRRSQWFGEVRYSGASDVPGTPSSPANFYNLAIQQQSTTNFVTPPASPALVGYSQSTRFSMTSYYLNSFAIWTT